MGTLQGTVSGDTLEVEYLIVGAGLAGSALGFLLQESGATTLNLELRDANAKDKLCAGFMIDAAVNALAEIYGEEALGSIHATDTLPIRWRCTGREMADGKALRVVERKLLDDYSLNRLRQAGGAVLDRTRIVSVDMDVREARCLDLRTGSTRLIRFGKLIGADGAISWVRKRLAGRCGRSVLSLEGVAPAGVRDSVVMSVEPGVSGYCWYAPRGNDATVGCFYPTLDAHESRKHLESFCTELGIEMPALRGAPIPSGDDMLLHAGDHAWLVGDAAGLADAFGGGGIHHALNSAKVLAESFAGGTPYEEAMRRTLVGLGAIARNVDAMYQQIWFATMLKGSQSGGSETRQQ